MIPTVEDILIDLAAGRITHAQAMAWMEQHFKLCAEEAFAPPEVAAIDLRALYNEIRIATFGFYDDCDEEHKQTLRLMGERLSASSPQKETK